MYSYKHLYEVARVRYIAYDNSSLPVSMTEVAPLSPAEPQLQPSDVATEGTLDGDTTDSKLNLLTHMINTLQLTMDNQSNDEESCWPAGEQPYDSEFWHDDQGPEDCFEDDWNDIVNEDYCYSHAPEDTVYQCEDENTFPFQPHHMSHSPDYDSCGLEVQIPDGPLSFEQGFEQQ